MDFFSLRYAMTTLGTNIGIVTFRYYSNIFSYYDKFSVQNDKSSIALIIHN